MFLPKAKRTVAKSGQVDDNGTEIHSGSGQGGDTSCDHCAPNLERSGTLHGAPGTNGGTKAAPTEPVARGTND